MAGGETFRGVLVTLLFIQPGCGTEGVRPVTRLILIGVESAVETGASNVIAEETTALFLRLVIRKAFGFRVVKLFSGSLALKVGPSALFGIRVLCSAVIGRAAPWLGWSRVGLVVGKALGGLCLGERAAVHHGALALL